MKKAFKDVSRLNKAKNPDTARTLCKLTEEIGELAQAINVTLGTKKGDPKKVRANVLEEAADSIQCIFSLCDLYKISFEEISAEILKKNGAWEHGKPKKQTAKKK